MLAGVVLVVALGGQRSDSGSMTIGAFVGLHRTFLALYQARLPHSANVQFDPSGWGGLHSPEAFAGAGAGRARRAVLRLLPAWAGSRAGSTPARSTPGSKNVR